MRDTLASTRVHGTLCLTGMLSNQWIVPNCYPIAYPPRGVRLTAYCGGSDDLPADVLQRYVDRLAIGEISLGPTRVYDLEQIREAHTDMERNRTFGKMVVTTTPKGVRA